MRTRFIDNRFDTRHAVSDPIERLGTGVILTLLGAMALRLVTSPAADPQVLATKRIAALCSMQPAALRPARCDTVMLPYQLTRS